MQSERYRAKLLTARRDKFNYFSLCSQFPNCNQFYQYTGMESKHFQRMAVDFSYLRRSWHLSDGSDGFQ